MSADTNLLTSDSKVEIVEQGIVADDRGMVHQKAITEIVGMIRTKFEEEGVRNFTIGKRALEHAQWQRGNFPGYTGSDFDTLMRRIRDDVRMYVAIKADSIQVADWVKAYVLRELVREQHGDVADQLSCFEYIRLTGKALSFDKKAVEGSLVAGWLDLIVGICFDRANDVRVTSEDFANRVTENEKRLKALEQAANPALASAVKGANDLITKANDARKANNAITTSVAEALAKGHVNPAGVMGIVEHVAKEMKLPMPAALGFDPANCTVADCDVLAATMMKSGKLVEMRHLCAVLGKMVSAAEKQLAAREAKIDRATADVLPLSAKVATEQKKAERELSKVG